MIRNLIVSWWCLIIVACTSQQVTITPVPTNTAIEQPTATRLLSSTPKPEVTATGVLLPDGLLMLGPNRYRSLIWSLSFSLPDVWDINNKLHLSSVDFGRETYTFYRDNVEDIDSRNMSPKITMTFETIPGEIDIKTFSEETLTKWQSDFLIDPKFIDQNELGLALSPTMAYEAQFMFEDTEYTLYIVHAIYQTMGVEITMESKSEMFTDIEPEFLYFLKNLSFE